MILGVLATSWVGLYRSSRVADGLASGYLHTSTIDPMIGARFSF